MNYLTKFLICSLLSALLGISLTSASAAEASKTKSSSKAKAEAAAAAPSAAPSVAPTAPTDAPAASTPVMEYQYSTRPAIAGGANPFNRLLKVAKIPHQPPSGDEIHDPTNEGSMILQKPLDAFEGLPQTETGLGNGVDWVKALDNGDLKPRWEKTNPDAEPMVMDMNIVRVPKSSMPDVVFPHRQHTLWLACSNCHPDIFIPRKGANQINMAAIILGQKCGVCHGKVSFPVSECKRCHSQPKTVAVNGGGPK
ncbi:MAG: c(7)-type cytochrome triheme domain-containing protein [Gallionella sp.]